MDSRHGPISRLPLYLQVRREFVSRITAGRWRPGYQLPSEVDLSREFGVSIGTIRKALDDLAGEMVVTRTQGRGTFVADPATTATAMRFCSIRDPLRQRVVGEIRSIASERRSATGPEAMRLVLESNEDVLLINRVLVHALKPYMAETCVLPVSLYPQLPEDLATYRITQLAEKNGLVLRDADESVTASSATEEDAVVFDISVGSPVLAIDRITYALDGRPVEWSFARCCTADVHYHARLR